MFEGTANESDNLEVKSCRISGANYGVFLDNSPHARCHHNAIQPKSGDGVDGQGVLVESQNAGDTVYVYANTVFNIRRFNVVSSANISGMQIRPGGTAVAYVYNNFIYGHSTPADNRRHGTLSGLLCGGGNIRLYNNSVYMTDVAQTDSLVLMAGINMTSASSTVECFNNIVVVAEDDTIVYGIRRGANNTLTSNNNCIFGSGPGFNVGFSGGAPLLDLAAWQALGYDANGVSGDPGYASATDLHIQPLFTLVDGAGTALPEVTDDIDGETRQNPPDMGADEYIGIHAPDAVVNLTVLRVGETNDVVLNWSPTAHAVSYRLYVDTVFENIGNLTNLIGTTGATTFTHVDGVAQPGSRHFYLVIASTDTAP
jgi:hypothetical protein